MIRVGLPWLLALLLPQMPPQHEAAPKSLDLKGEIVEAYLQRDWPTVADELRSDDRYARDPVSRMLLAHACLGLDQGNEAAALVRSSIGASDQHEWSRFTDELVTQYPDSSEARMLRADALARSDRVPQALSALDEVLDVEGDNHRAFAMRAAARCILSMSDEGLLDAILATRLAPERADSWLVLANVYAWIGADDGARVAAEKALAIQPELALAHRTKAILDYHAGGFQQALIGLDTARLMEPSLADLIERDQVIITLSFEAYQEQLRSGELGAAGTSMTAVLKPKIVAERWLPEGLPWSKPTAYLGENLPALGRYHETPTRPQLSAPSERRVVHDQIVLHKDYSKVVDGMNQLVGIVGAAKGAKSPATLGPIDAVKISENRIPHPHQNSTRLRVLDDGSWALMRIEPSSGKYAAISKPEAATFLHSQMTYMAKLDADQDRSYTKLYENLTGSAWDNNLAQVPSRDIATAVQMPRSSPVTVTHQGEQYEMTAGSFLAGNLPRLAQSLEVEREATRQFRQAYSAPTKTWGVVFDEPKLEYQGRRRDEVFDTVKYSMVFGPGPGGPGIGGGDQWKGPPGGGIGGPGGVSTEELARAWIDRGDHTIRVRFTLLFNPDLDQPDTDESDDSSELEEH